MIKFMYYKVFKVSVTMLVGCNNSGGYFIMASRQLRPFPKEDAQEAKVIQRNENSRSF